MCSFMFPRVCTNNLCQYRPLQVQLKLVSKKPGSRALKVLGYGNYDLDSPFQGKHSGPDFLFTLRPSYTLLAVQMGLKVGVQY